MMFKQQTRWLRLITMIVLVIPLLWATAVETKAQGLNSPPSARPPRAMFNPQSLRVVYGSNFFVNDATARDRLLQMSTSGANTIILSSWQSEELSSFIATIRTDPILSKYKVILGIGGPIYDAWRECLRNSPQCNEDQNLPNSIRSFLDRIVILALSNQDMIVGYYTFDEPALVNLNNDIPELNGKKGISKYFQEHIYNYIRTQDPNSVDRPILLANTMWSIDDETIDRAMSVNAQDIIFIDQYAFERSMQIQWLNMWKTHNLLADPIVFVLPAYGQTSCTNPNLVEFSQMLNDVWKETLDNREAQPYGFAYFAFWPGDKPDFLYGIENCTPIFDSVISHLQAWPPNTLVFLPMLQRRQMGG